MLCGSMVCVCGVLYECTENIDCVWYECTDKVCVLHEYTDALVWVAVLYECMTSKLLHWNDDSTMHIAAVLLTGAPSEKGQQVVASSYPLLTMTTVKTLAHNISRYLRYRTATSLSIRCLVAQRKNARLCCCFAPSCGMVVACYRRDKLRKEKMARESVSF